MCVLSAKGPLSLPGQTVLSPLDRWPTPSLSSSPSLHLSLFLSLYHCLPLLQPPKHLITSVSPSFPTSQHPSLPSHLSHNKSKWDGACAAHSNLSHFHSRAHFLSQSPRLSYCYSFDFCFTGPEMIPWKTSEIVSAHIC